MKKKILLISVCLVLILAILLQTNVFATTTTLEKIAEAFNKSKTIGEYEKLLGYELIASTNEGEPNVLSITIKSDKFLSLFTKRYLLCNTMNITTTKQYFSCINCFYYSIRI